MRFHYPLQKIVDLKGSQKSMAEWAYAASLGRLREAKEALQVLTAERSETEKRLARSSEAAVTLAELTSLQHYLDLLDAKIRKQMEEVGRAENQVNMRQSQLAERAVDEKVWLNAREKARLVHLRETLAKQQNELDEIATVRAFASRG